MKTEYREESINLQLSNQKKEEKTSNFSKQTETTKEANQVTTLGERKAGGSEKTHKVIKNEFSIYKIIDFDIPNIASDICNSKTKFSIWLSE